MSDNWIELVPDDPYVVPHASRQKQAKPYFAKLFPDADEIKAETFDTVRYFSCGPENLVRVCCPSCDKEIPMTWWRDQMHKDFADGFQLAEYSMPCCREKFTLNDLEYEGNQAFGMFALSAWNPRIDLKDKDREELERILGVELRVVYEHL